MELIKIQFRFKFYIFTPTGQIIEDFYISDNHCDSD